jgi:LPS-assembly lipoprotein
VQVLKKDSISPGVWPLLLLLSLLAGCGFHLKGYQQSASPVLDGLYVVAGEQRSSLAGTLSHNLRISGIKMATSGESARARVEIIDEQLLSRVLAVDAGGKALDRELRLVASFRLSYTSGRESQTQTLELVRQLSYGGSDELGQRNETAMLTNEMRNDMANQIIRRLEALLRQ